MKKKIFVIIFIIIIGGTGFAMGLATGWGILFRSIHPPQSTLVDLLWETRDTLKERYLKANGLSDEDLLYGAIRGLVDAAGDPYTSFFTPDEARLFLEDVRGHFSGIGAEIGFRNRILSIIAPIPNSPAERVGLRASDAILAIDNEPTNDMTLEEAVTRIRGPEDSTVTLRIFREGEEEPRDYVIARERIDIPVLNVDRRYGNIAVIELFNFTEDAPTRFRESASELAQNPPRGIVLDLRNNPGGILDAAVEIAGWFLPSGQSVVIERQRDKADVIRRTEGPGTLNDIPLVILVNGGTASAAEILAGALNEQRNAPLVGDTTFGKGTIQEFPPLSGGAALKVTIGEWLTPNGTSLAEEGLAPTIEMIDDLDTETDETLDRAVELLNQQQ